MYRLCVQVDLNGRIGDRVSAGITGPLESQERTIMEEEQWSYVFNMYVEHNILHKGSKLRWSGGKEQ